VIVAGWATLWRCQRKKNNDQPKAGQMIAEAGPVIAHTFFQQS